MVYSLTFIIFFNANKSIMQKRLPHMQVHYFIILIQLSSMSFNSCAFFLLDARTFFWHFSAKTRITEISVATDHQKHVVQVESGLKTRPALTLIVISGPLPAKLPIENLPQKNFCALKFQGESLGTVFENHAHTWRYGRN